MGSPADIAPPHERLPAAVAKHPGTAANTEGSLRVVLNQLTPEERLICIWKRLGFSSREIARPRAGTRAAIDRLFNNALAKIRR